jgi:hypothetical protein
VGRSLGKAFSFGGVGGRTADVDIVVCFVGGRKGRVSFRSESQGVRLFGSWVSRRFGLFDSRVGVRIDTVYRIERYTTVKRKIDQRRRQRRRTAVVLRVLFIRVPWHGSATPWFCSKTDGRRTRRMEKLEKWGAASRPGIDTVIGSWWSCAEIDRIDFGKFPETWCVCLFELEMRCLFPS